MALQVGSRLGHYDVTALIGEGGMGQVYQATDTKLNRQVALKILPEAFATAPDRLASQPYGERDMSSRSYAAIVLGLVLAVCVSVQAQTEDSMTYVWMYTDEDEISHFEDVSVPFEQQQFAPPAPPFGVSVSTVAESSLFVFGPLGWDGTWHPTPRRQWVVMLTGEVEITVGDGEVRTFGPGDVILFDDAVGRGHLTNVTTPEGVTAMMVAIAEE